MRKFKPLLFLIAMGLATLGCKKAATESIEDNSNQATARSVLAGKPKKVLFIGIDGCVWKAITAANAPNLKTLMDQSYTSTNALAEVPTWSSNGWSALFTGVGVAKHKASDNSFSGADFVNYPSFFRQIKTSLPALRTASIVTWSSINNYIVATPDVTVKQNSASDNATEVRIIQEITSSNTDVAFCHFDDVDHAGHASNYRTTTQMYMDSVKAVDARVGRILNAVKARPTYNNEDWLIVVATDHGGDSSHGGSSYLERNAFIILNNSAITPQLVNTLPTTNTESNPHSITTVDFKTNVYGQLPTLSNLDLSATGSFTIEFRARATTATSDPVIIGNKNWASGYNKGIIIANRNGVIRANFGDGTHRLDIDGVDLTDQLWHQVAVVVNRSTQKATMYDGGIQVAEGNISAVGDLQSGTTFKIGQDGTTNYSPYFTGNISEIRLFKSALPASSISAYSFTALTSAHPQQADLVLYTKGDETSGTAYNGTLVTPKIDILTKSSATITRSALTTAIFYRKTTDYHGAPYLYSVPPTILSFLGITPPSYYDGQALVNF
ncbi:alkaline phosphatase family protein [Pedobacter kyungheensis]|uniref:alkaline phosphatase family protein n=1 Tax=Pedobacter kyungheensis TaxID=1069985 RepID=UPI0009E3D839|nr:alkaline phosphatase family protein [Pedobacter kyungheensis]